MNDVAVIGAGPAGLMAGERLARAGHRVTIYDAMPSAGRKFLLAGRGGLNLTHSEPLDRFLPRYREATAKLEPLIRRFRPEALREWCTELGEPTFVGSSGRVFPEGFKASPLLRAWLRRLAEMGVSLQTGHLWSGFDAAGRLLLRQGDRDVVIAPEATVLALGGASWPRLGSTGAWTEILTARGVDVAPLRPSNCGFRIAWTPFVVDRYVGQPLKRIALGFAGEVARGEAMLTAEGLEGGAVYALSAPVRETVQARGQATISLDLRPDVAEHKLAAAIAAGRGTDSLTNRLRKHAGLSPAAIAVLRDATPDLAGRDAMGLAAAIRRVELKVMSVRPIDRAISSAGGVRWSELDDGLMLHPLPGVFCAGEMIDWEAPTGGYLLQACFATGVAAAAGVTRWLSR